jgi:hypothetical protein
VLVSFFPAPHDLLSVITALAIAGCILFRAARRGSWSGRRVADFMQFVASLDTRRRRGYPASG